MKITAAVVDNENEAFAIRDTIEISELGENDVQVHLVASGICHSDEAVRNGDAKIGYPVIPGHEGSGVVEKVGRNVTQVVPGDHVVMSYCPCGKCKNCLSGHPTRCINFAKNNLCGYRPDGTPHFHENGEVVFDVFNQSSFATTAIVDERNIIRVPKNLDLRKLGPLGCGYMTGSGTVFNALKPEPGSTIAVFGTGAVGLAAMMAGRIAGCAKIIGVDIVSSRLELALELGATDVINSKDVDPVKAILALTDGLGVDYTVDTTGVVQVMKSTVDCLTQGGTAGMIAVTPRAMEIKPWEQLAVSDRTIKGVLMGDAIPQVDIPRLLNFYERGLFDFDKTEQFYSFDQINQANEDSKSGKTIKPVLIIDPAYQPE